MKKLPLKLTLGDKYDPAMKIEDQAAADAYFELLVLHHLDLQESEGKIPSRDVAERTERINLGYYAGYYSSQTRERVERLFHCAHPIFGAIAANGQPTPEQAALAGDSTKP